MCRFADLRRRPFLQNQLTNPVGKVQKLVDRRAPMVAGASALDAALAFVKGKGTPLFGVQAGFLQFLFGIADGLLAVRADSPHQALRQYAVQRGNEIVRLHAHVQKAAQHVDYVVCVHRGEHQVAGKRGLDRDLRRLGVADFTQNDLVRIVAQDGPQSAGEGEAFFLIDRNLRNAVYLVFDRVFDRNDLVFVSLDLVQRGVERGGFAAARGPGDQHHSIGLQNVAPELAQVFFIEADDVQHQVAELFAHRFLVQHAEHGIFAVNGRHNGNAEVDQTSAVFHAETPVLRHAPLGNIELAHDLDTGDDGGVVLLGHRLHGGLKHAVNAVLHYH